jgi:hypothetical protein
MYRVIAVLSAGLVVAACSSDSSKLFGFEPAKETLRLESNPPGADAKIASGETCRTPCALAVPVDKAFSVTFTLAGYQPATEEIQIAGMGDGTAQLRPNPVIAELTAVPPPKKKTPARKQAAKPKPQAKPVAAAPPPAVSAPPPPSQQPQVSSPWPGTPAPQR